MENNLIDLEQPVSVHDQGEGISQNEDMGQDETLGSNLGKFKDEKALLEAYNNLQSEFTKKCQILAKMQSKDNEKETPLFLQEDWDVKVDEFLQRNPEAEDYVSEITNMILRDKVIAVSKTPLEDAWKEIAVTNFKSPKKMLSDKEFLEKHILNDEGIQKTIIEKYISNVYKNTSPKIMGDDAGGKVVLTPPSKPKNLQEAGNIAREMLK